MRKFLIMLGIVGLLGTVAAVGAAADEFVPDPDTVDVDLDVDPVTQNVDITLVEVNNQPPNGFPGCDIQGTPGQWVDAVASSSDPSVATVAWASGDNPQRFEDCGDTHALEITAVDCGVATVTVSESDRNAPAIAVFSDAVIAVTVTGTDCGGMTVCAEPAAPAWANAILQAYNASVPKAQQIKAKDYGAAVAAVGQEMDTAASFHGVAKSEQNDYADAVWQFLQGYTGKTLPHPSDAGVARPGWSCATV